ncbi:putative gustatory receptor 28b [Malaya genurostris]|uniref:putative gustatory receptor 28b n=1 Tax=Malaya genurostris TaxID=325434 RepID=UPI0026F3D99D|nr:putative gustatory receptor 28b [Malaya genurostris]
MTRSIVGRLSGFFLRSESIYDVFLVNHAISKLFGLTIYSVVRETDKYRIKVTLSDVLGLLWLLFMQGFMFYVALVILNRFQSTGSEIMDNGMKYSFLFFSNYVLLSSIENYWRYGHILMIWRKFDEFDARARKMNASIDHSSEKQHFFRAFAFLFLALITVQVSGYITLSYVYPLRIRLFVTTSFLFFSVPYTIIHQNVYIICQSVCNRLNHVNRAFGVHFVPQKKANQLLMNELPAPRGLWDKAIVLDQLTTLWTQITELTQMVSHVFVAQIIAITVTSTMMITFSLFTFYRAQLGEDYHLELISLTYLKASAFYVLILAVLIEKFDAIKREAKQTAVLVHKALREDDNKHLREELIAFSLLLNHRPVRITCALFDCDWTMGVSIIGTISSYLVILIQFDVIILPVPVDAKIVV